MSVSYDNGIFVLNPSQPNIPENIPIVEAHQHYKFPQTLNRYGTTGGHSYKKNREKRSIGLSVLTLLSFLFFLHILQNCLQEQVDNTNPQPQVVIMQAKLKSRDEQEQIEKAEFPKLATDNLADPSKKVSRFKMGFK